MWTAAAGLLAALVFSLVWSPGKTSPSVSGVQVQESDAWLDREAAASDVPAQDRIVIDALLRDLGEGTATSREAAEQLLKNRLESAIPFLRKAAQSDNSDVRSSATSLIRIWEDRRRRISLAELLATARAKSKSKPDLKDLAERAVAGDAGAIADVRKLGWAAAPSVAAAAAPAAPADQLRARELLRDLLMPLLHQDQPTVTLKCRKRNDQEYKASAFSFRYATQDADAIKNIVDVVYNPCGLLHFTPYGGTETHVADAGKQSLAQVTELPSRGWRRADCIVPKEGHVYVVEIRTEGLSTTYKFEVLNVTSTSIELKWSGIGEPHAPPAIDPKRGANGSFGVCPGRHAEY